MNPTLEIQKQDFTFIGKNSNLQGSFQLNGTTHLAGNIEGELTMRENFSLVIERDGSFKGTMTCNKIEIYGRFQGTLRSFDSVVIYPSAKVTGDINAKNLVIHPGAVINMDGQTEQMDQ